MTTKTFKLYTKEFTSDREDFDDIEANLYNIFHDCHSDSMDDYVDFVNSLEHASESFKITVEVTVKEG